MFKTEMKVFKWWYVYEFNHYTDLLGAKQATIIAMTPEEEIINRKLVDLRTDENQLVIADCKEEGEFYLTPNQMLSVNVERIKQFWLTDGSSYNTPEIQGIYTAIESGQSVVLPTKRICLYGSSSQDQSSLSSRKVRAFVPIGDGTYIAWEDGGKCYFVSDRETDELTIRINLKRFA